VAALHSELPDFEPAGIAAGLHLVAYMPPDLDEPMLIERAARRGVAIYGLAPYYLSNERRAGLIFGYANLEEDILERGVQILAQAVDDVRRANPTG